MAFNESDTRGFLIDPKLKELGWWTSDCIQTEYYFTKGKKEIVGDKVKHGKPQKADYLLKFNGIHIGVLEAKEEGEPATKGMQQAKDYAETLDVKFAYSSNGHSIEEFDFCTNEQKTIERFPTPQELTKKIHS